jgi:hypothetical protein
MGTAYVSRESPVITSRDFARHRHTEAPRAPRLNHKPFDSGSHYLAVEVEQQSDGKTKNSHVGEELRLVDTDQSFHALDLHDNTTFNYEVGLVFSNEMSFVENRDTNMSRKGQTGFRQFDTECSFVGRFEKARPELSMDLDAATDDLVSEWIVFVH